MLDTLTGISLTVPHALETSYGAVLNSVLVTVSLFGVTNLQVVSQLYPDTLQV
ncbi:hypothetical protein SERLADRAFT_458445 [Serpula lacrymans var. lacrymans S7.9]|uniref:Uncharacterized protein n=1 Tax=Serpula lacrymans var. lacrymans (strain S7.9) TaxID=578457 RepID=F8NIU1_SERL9|nr:uncharacterized protein SERLADRAFT_458445 [Serpula lacrymans var. lacrymans S7.9]EGO30006.1 hypothetical protein SERLADRAFT_458445 [Serpula lacrymans var. lacrymans S7.9]